MTEDDARARIAAAVPRETFAGLEQLCALILAESERQNLIAASTIPAFWARHMLDSAQLVWLAQGEGPWLDIGSGAGLPGLVVAVMRNQPTFLVEPRAKRATFLREAAEALGVADRTIVIAGRIETATLPAPAAILSARAVAGLDALFAMGAPHAASDALWLLPKGRSAAGELAEARRTWQGEMRLVPSLSDPESAIIVARGMRRMSRR